MYGNVQVLIKGESQQGRSAAAIKNSSLLCQKISILGIQRHLHSDSYCFRMLSGVFCTVSIRALTGVIA